MEVKQIYELVNSATKEVLGKSDLVATDLSNIVDVGTEIFDSNATDNYVKSLVNHIGKVIFVNRPYSGNVPSVLMDAWEFGSVLEKISADIPEAEENESWDLKDRESYDTNVFYKPTVSAKFFNKRITYDIPMSFTEKQIKESFDSATQMNGFLSMLYNAVDKSMTVKMDSLIMRTIDNMIAETIIADYYDTKSKALTDMTVKSGIKAVNLLNLYNKKFGKTITAENAVNDSDFIRFATYTIGLYKDRLSKISTLFNVGGKERFTSADNLHVVLLSEFVASANAYLQSDVFHNELVALPKAETVPYWQGSGTSYDFGSTSKINVKSSTGIPVTANGIIGVMFDTDSIGVCNLDRRVTSSYNAKAEFYTNYYKFDAGYYNDLNENFVVFFVA